MRLTAALLALLALLPLLAALPARAQDDGPRVYQLAPKDAQTLTAFWVIKRGNEGPEPGEVVGGTKTKNDIVVLRWAKTFDAGGRQLSPFVIVPMGKVRSQGAAGTFESSGLGDGQIGATLGLSGAPALSREDYAAFRPELTSSLLARVFVPTGDYDSSRPVNLGANHFAFQLGLPTTVMLGQSYRAPDLTALEVLPTVTVYETNDDPFGGARRVSKDPLFSTEAHLTHNFGRKVWASVDVLYRLGAETTTDGVGDDNRIEGWSAGGSAAVVFPRNLSLILTYEHVVDRNDSGPDGWFFRTALVRPF
jgi:hypothetical protein